MRASELLAMGHTSRACAAYTEGDATDTNANGRLLGVAAAVVRGYSRDDPVGAYAEVLERRRMHRCDLLTSKLMPRPVSAPRD